MKKVYLMFLFVLGLLFTLTSCNNNKKSDIVSTSFAGYDFSKGVAKDVLSSSMLLNPGEELHDYSPSVSDIERILNAKVFIYIGGESDSEWVENDILPEINKNKTKVINMMDVIKSNGSIYNEEDPESSDAEEEGEEEEEYDEHVWNSITNAKLIVEEIYNVLSTIDSENADKYLANKNEYINSLNEVDTNIKELVSNSSKKLLVFADRFPLLYFVKEYNLEYDAAFKGCESSKEASAITIEKLTKKVENNNLKVVFVIELSESNIANTIIKNCKKDGFNVEIKTFYTMHNVSKDDYKNGLTYIDFMNKNIEVLRLALN